MSQSPLRLLQGLRRWLLGAALVFCLPLAAWGQISLVGVATGNGGSGAVSSLAITKPAGVTFGDLLIAQVAVNSATPTVTAPTGWTLVDEVTSGTVRQRLFYRVANDSEPASYTFTLSSSGRVAGGITALRGAEMIAPIFAPYSERADSGASLVANEVTASRAGSLLVSFFAVANGGAAVTVNTPSASSYTLASGGAASGVALAAGRETLAAVGPTGTRTATSTVSANYVSQMVAVRPAVQSCFTDNFDRTSGIGADWGATARSGTFTPTIVSNRLRMTQAVTSQATAATLNRLFAAAGNLVTVEVDHFAYAGNGADGLVFVLSDAAVTPQPGGYGGSLGYAPRCGISGFAGGWLGVGLDEFGNFSNPTECRTGGPGSRSDAVTVRGSGPNYVYLAGTNTLSPGIDKSGSTPAPNLRYRITIDSRVAGEAWVSVERTPTTGGAYATLVSRFNALANANQAAVPTDFYFSMASGTGDNYNIHEIDNLQICALDMRAATSQIDHFRFFYDGSANTCAAEAVRVLACADSTCSSLYTGTTTITLATSGGAWEDAGGNALSPANTVTFSGGSVNLLLSRTTAGTEALNVTASTPATKPLSVPACYNSATNAAFADCNLTFTGTQTFTFGVAPANVIPAQEAGVPSAAIRIKANNAACGGAPSAFINKTQSVQFWYSYLDPVQATVNSYIASGQPLLYLDPYEAATNTTATFYALGTTQAGATARSVYFNSSGEGYFLLLYPDVGQLQLSAAVSAQSISGTGAFVVKPYEFLVSNVLRTSDSAANPAAADASGSVFITAGDSFTATVTARNASHKLTDGSGSAVLSPVPAAAYGRVAKLYGKEQTPEGVRVAADAAQLQPTGGNNPAIGNGDIAGSAFGTGASLGTATLTNLNWPEVGIIRLQPRVLPQGSETTGDYLGAGDVIRYTSPNIGRFIPYQFGVTAAAVTNRSAAACAVASSFTYLDEGIGLGFTLQALAKGGGVTKNYTGSFAKLNLPSGGSTLGLAAAVPAPSFAALTGRLAASGFAATWPAVGDASGGQASLGGTVTISSLASPSNNRVAADGPFLGASIGIAPTDSDGVRILTYDLDSDNSGGPGGADHRSLGSTNLYFGQMRLLPAYGSERLPIAMTAEILRWNGTAFVPNGDDNCTRVPAARLGLGNWTKNLAAGETSFTSGNLGFAAGRATLRLAAPGAGNDGNVDVTVDLAGAGMGYLATRRGGSAKYDRNPSATAAFGVYKGASQIIHLREMY